MAFSIEEIRRVENLEHAVAVHAAQLSALFSHTGAEQPPVPDHPGEYGLRQLRPADIPPAAVNAMLNGLSEEDRQKLMEILAKAAGSAGK